MATREPNPSIRAKLYAIISAQRDTMRKPETRAVLRVLDRVRKWKDIEVNASVQYGFSASVIVRELNGFRDVRLKRVLAAFDPLISGEWSTRDDTAYRSRDFAGHVAGLGQIAIIAQLNDAPKHCRVIEIARTKRVEEREDVQSIFVCT